MTEENQTPDFPAPETAHHNEKLLGAILELNDAVGEHWTKGNVPNIDYLKKATGIKQISRAQVEELSARVRVFEAKTGKIGQYKLLTNLSHNGKKFKADELISIDDIGGDALTKLIEIKVVIPV